MSEASEAPLPQFELDDLDDMVTRADPNPPVAEANAPEAGPSRPKLFDAVEEVSAELDVEPSDDGETIIPLVPRSPSS